MAVAQANTRHWREEHSPPQRGITHGGRAIADPHPDPDYDVVVVGGGLVGSAAAYHCACAGLRTLLVERHELSSGASGANFGMVQVQDSEPGLSLELTLESFDLHRTLEAELDWDLERRPMGLLLLIENERQRELMVERAEMVQAAGIEVQLLDHQGVERLEPSLAPDTYIGALHDPNEAQLDPFALVRAYVARGQERDLAVQLYTTATGLQTTGSRVTGLETTKGTVAAQNVVLCTGAWTREIGLRIGLDFPLKWVHGEALVTEPMPRLVRNSMITSGFFETVHVDQEDGHQEDTPVVGFCLTPRPNGQILLGESSLITDRIATHSTFGGMPAVAIEGVRRVPRLAQAKMVRTWATSVLFTDDHRPLLGPVDGYDGLFMATGLKSTIILTPLVGRLVADMVAGKPIDPRLAEFSPMRMFSQR